MTTYKLYRFILTQILLAPIYLWAQSPREVAVQQIQFPLLTTLQPASASVTRIGNPGNAAYYYWTVPNYTIGAGSPYLVGAVLGAPNTLSGSNYVQVSPNYPLGIVSVDLLRTNSPIAPSGACNCAVATSVTSGAINDQSNNLNSYTVTSANLSALTLTLDNEAISAGVSHLILRQNGALIADLSTGAGGSVTGSGTANSFPIWTGPTALGNSNLSAVTSPNGFNYAIGGGQSIQVDASHISFNSGIAAPGSIAIANTFAPASGFNAGGIILIGASATGSACAGNAALDGGQSNSSGNDALVAANGGCSNGFGAIGGSVLIRGGSTVASNPGGDITLQPGTGNFGNGNVIISAGAGAGLKNNLLTVANLGTPANGTQVYASDATLGSNPCSGGGSGAFAVRINGSWNCSAGTSAIKGSGGTPTVSAGPGAGGSPTISLATGSTDAYGGINLTAGTSPLVSQTVATLTFSTTYTRSFCEFSQNANLPTNAQISISTTASAFSFTDQAAALAASGSYFWFYHCDII